MNRQDYLASTTTSVDIAFSALPDAPVVPVLETSTPAATDAAIGAAPVLRLRRQLASGLQRTAAWVEPTPKAHSAA
jgi:hypothetical protein